MNRWAAVARFGGIGDNLIAASPLRALKRMGYMTEVITSPPNNSVFLHRLLSPSGAPGRTERQDSGV